MRIEKSFVEQALAASELGLDRETYAARHRHILAVFNRKEPRKPLGSNADRKSGDLFAQERIHTGTFMPVELTSLGIVGIGPRGLQVVNWFAGVIEKVA